MEISIIKDQKTFSRFSHNFENNFFFLDFPKKLNLNGKIYYGISIHLNLIQKLPTIKKKKLNGRKPFIHIDKKFTQTFPTTNDLNV